jgi:DNA-binding transcriptional LysR family regulator
MNVRDLKDIELRQICYFLAITEAGNSFSKAAASLYIETPALRQRIKSLERRLKLQLFNYAQQPAKLTAAGEVFLSEIQITLASLDRAITRAKSAELGEIGCLSIGIASSISNTLLPDILRTFSDRFPGVKLELRELTADRQIQALTERRLDVGFEVIDNFDRSQLSIMPILKESLVVALPLSHRLVTQSHICLSDLATENLILPSTAEFPFYQQFITHCQQVGCELTIVENIKATWLVTILSLVVAAVGIAILPSNVQILQRQGVVYRTIEDVNLNRQISAIWRKDDRSAALHEFLQVVQELSIAILKDSAD